MLYCDVFLKGEDVVVMAQALEKLFKSKLAQMPKEEIKIESTSGKTVKKKPKPPPGTLVGGPGVATPGINKMTAKPIEQQPPFLQLPAENSSNIPPSAIKPISSIPDVQNLHTLINQPPAATNPTPQVPTSSAPYLMNQSINSVPVSQQPAKVKKGVKRKADTTTPTAIGFNESIDAKVSTRGRQVNIIK